MAFHGADVQELDALAAYFGRTADQLNTLAANLSMRLMNTPWTGLDATKFRDQWKSLYVPAINAVVSDLRNVQEEVTANAQQQREASSATATPSSTSAGNFNLDGLEKELNYFEGEEAAMNYSFGEDMDELQEEQDEINDITIQ